MWSQIPVLLRTTNYPLELNPARKLGQFVKSQEPTHGATALTAQETERFLESAREFCPHRYPLFLTALRPGLREGELAALRWGDIQFGESDEDPNRFILVQRTYDPRTRKFLTPKNKRRRRVDLSKELRQVLLRQRDQRLLEAFAKGNEEVSDELVFPSEAGTPLEMDNVIRRQFLPLLEQVVSGESDFMT